jgi:hypothetical protein
MISVRITLGQDFGAEILSKSSFVQIPDRQKQSTNDGTSFQGKWHCDEYYDFWN